MVKEKVLNRDTQDRERVVRHTALGSLNFLMASKFLLGLRPKCFEQQVTTSLLSSRKQRNTEGIVLLYQMSPFQIAALVDNQYSLKKLWLDIWGHSVGGKFTLSLNSFIAEMDSELWPS
jgi:hypothetical protein